MVWVSGSANRRKQSFFDIGEHERESRTRQIHPLIPGGYQGVHCWPEFARFLAFSRTIWTNRRLARGTPLWHKGGIP